MSWHNNIKTMKQFIQKILLEWFGLVPLWQLNQALFAQRLAESQSETIVRAIRGKKIIGSQFDKADFQELYCESIFVFDATINIQKVIDTKPSIPLVWMISGTNYVNVTAPAQPIP